MAVEKSLDWKTLDAIARRPEVYVPMAFDGAPPQDQITVRKAVENRDNIFYIVWVDNQPAGFFMGEWKHPLIWEIHTNLSGLCRGSAALAAGRMARDLFFRNDSATALTSTCPDYNPVSLWFALRCGFKKAGHENARFQRDGAWYGATRVMLTDTQWEEIEKGLICP